MRVLIIKTSSMGDIIHTLPAITDAKQAYPDILFDWVVEENFAEIPAWHPAVNTIIPVAIRRWRQSLFSKNTLREWCAFRRALRRESYDLILDAQGLTKSAVLTWIARGKSVGLASRASRDPFSALFYRHSYFVDPHQHAIDRMRDLFSQALHYPKPTLMPDYGIHRAHFYEENELDPYIIFLHGTTWPTKQWPDAYWMQLAKIANQQGITVKLLWGTEAEKARASQIAAACSSVTVLPRLNLKEIANVLACAKAIVAVDTGLSHLAAALNVPTLSLYGPTDPRLTGALGASQKQLTAQFSCAPCLQRECTSSLQSDSSFMDPPCFTAMTPEKVWAAFRAYLS